MNQTARLSSTKSGSLECDWKCLQLQDLLLPFPFLFHSRLQWRLENLEGGAYMCEKNKEIYIWTIMGQAFPRAHFAQFRTLSRMIPMTSFSLNNFMYRKNRWPQQNRWTGYRYSSVWACAMHILKWQTFCQNLLQKRRAPAWTREGCPPRIMLFAAKVVVGCRVRTPIYHYSTCQVIDSTAGMFK